MGECALRALLGPLLKHITGSLESALFMSAGVYVLTNILNAAIPFLLIPVLTRYLSPVDYGIITISQIIVGLITPFIGVNTHGAIGVKFFQKDKVNVPCYISSCLILVASSSVIMWLVFQLFDYPISQLSQFPQEWLWVTVLLCAGQFIITILLTVLQSSSQALSYGLLQVTQTATNFGLTLLLVIVLHHGWEGRIAAQAVSLTAFAMISLYILWRNGWLVLSCKIEYIQDALRFGMPLIPHALAGFAMAMGDRVIIAKIVGLADLGVYSVGFQIATIIGLLESSFNQAWVPWLYRNLAKGGEEAKVKIVRLTYLYNIGLVLIAVLLAVIAPQFLKVLVGERFLGASQYIFWVAMGYACGGMYKMVAGYLFYQEKTGYLATATAFVACGHVVICYLMVSAFGSIGAAQAMTISNMLLFLLTWVISNKVYKMPWFDLGKLFHN